MTAPANRDRFATLTRIMARLRGPRGCPWDKKQTHLSLRESFMEECYETLEAIDENDPTKLKEELGDLLLHIVFQSRIAAEAGEFDIKDVIEGITTKLVRRHPHIFSGVKVKDAEEVALNWEELKKEEKNGSSPILDGVPGELPALAQAQSLQRRAAGVGFDWPDVEGVLDKIYEETRELAEAGDSAQRTMEMGDLLFSIVNLSRRLDISAEAALREANRRFKTRFTRMEEICLKRGVRLADLPLKEQDRIWDKAKKDTQG